MIGLAQMLHIILNQHIPRMYRVQQRCLVETLQIFEMKKKKTQSKKAKKQLILNVDELESG